MAEALADAARVQAATHAENKDVLDETAELIASFSFLVLVAGSGFLGLKDRKNVMVQPSEKRVSLASLSSKSDKDVEHISLISVVRIQLLSSSVVGLRVFVRLPEQERMIEMYFRSMAERQLFATALRYCSHTIAFDIDGEQKMDGVCPRFSVSAPGTMGIHREVFLGLHATAGLLEYGRHHVARTKDVKIVVDAEKPRRMTMTFPPINLTFGEKFRDVEDWIFKRGDRVRPDIDALLRDQKTKPASLTVTFPSVWSRERFAGRLRASALGLDASDTSVDEMTLPSGETLKVCCSTYNCGGKAPGQDLKDLSGLSLWLRPGEYDIYCVGFQENSQRKKWTTLLTQYFAKSPCPRRPPNLPRLAADEPAFSLLSVSLLWDIHVYVFVRADLQQRISNICTTTEATGIGHILGNKGAAAVGFTLDYNTNICVVNSHLAARATRLVTRMENFEEISYGISRKLSGHSYAKGLEFVHQFDYVFWMGDLNYRIDMGNHGTEHEFRQTMGLVRGSNFPELHKFDQLKLEREKQRVFVTYDEGIPVFKPTYRMVKGSETYSNKKNQNPSYCDRVLWRSPPSLKNCVKQTFYNGCFKMKQSDHRPVSAGFKIPAMTPYICRKTNSQIGVWDSIALLLKNVTLRIAPDVSSLKANTERYDGFTGDMMINFRARFLESTKICTATTKCANRGVIERVNRTIGGATPAKEKIFFENRASDGSKSGAEDTEAMTPTRFRDDSSPSPKRRDDTPTRKRRGLQLLKKKVSNDGAELEVDEDLLNPLHPDLPSWSFGDNAVPILFATECDCEQLSLQSLNMAVYKGATMDYPMFGTADIGIRDAYMGMMKANEMLSKIHDPDFDVVDALKDPYWTDDEVGFVGIPLGSLVEGVDMDDALRATIIRNVADKIREKPFVTRILRKGKWIGTINGTLTMHYMPGIASGEMKEVDAERIRYWTMIRQKIEEQKLNLLSTIQSVSQPRTVERITGAAEQQRPKSVAALQSFSKTAASQSIAARAKVSQSVRLDHVQSRIKEDFAELNAANTKDAMELSSPLGSNRPTDKEDVDKKLSRFFSSREASTASKIVTEEDVQAVEAFVLYRFDMKRSRYERVVEVDDVDSHSEDEDDKPRPKKRTRSAAALRQSVDPELVQSTLERAGRKAYIHIFSFDQAEEFAMNGRLLCSRTGNEILDEFVLYQDRPYSRVGLLEETDDAMCMSCLKEFESGETLINAVDHSWHSDCFCCTHTGTLINLWDPYYIVDGLPYSETSYLDLFHHCSNCGNAVPFAGQECDEMDVGIIAVDKLWHKGCFVCAQCGKALADSDHYPWDNGGGNNLQPYCGVCIEQFMPVCPACGDAVNTFTAAHVEACGSTWHTDHFRCAASGVVLDKFYYERDGYPYSEEKYVELFAERCVTCGEAILDKIIRAMGQSWHPEHFVCSSSGQVISPTDDGVLQFYEHNLQPYCREEYSRLFCMPCRGCGLNVVDDALEVDGDLWHPWCLRCTACEKVLDVESVYISDDGKPYCLDDFITAFGPICPGCERNVSPTTPSTEALESIWHVEHFLCGGCLEPLAGRVFIPLGDFAACDTCYNSRLAPTCAYCSLKVATDEPYVALPQSETEQRIFHQHCYRCSRCDKAFQGGDAVLLKDGYPHCDSCFEMLFASHFCASCGRAIIEPRVDALGQHWHPECLRKCFVCATALPGKKMFVWKKNNDSDICYPVCKDHLLVNEDAIQERLSQTGAIAQHLEAQRDFELEKHQKTIKAKAAAELDAKQRQNKDLAQMKRRLHRAFAAFRDGMRKPPQEVAGQLVKPVHREETMTSIPEANEGEGDVCVSTCEECSPKLSPNIKGADALSSAKFVPVDPLASSRSIASARRDSQSSRQSQSSLEHSIEEDTKGQEEAKIERSDCSEPPNQAKTATKNGPGPLPPLPPSSSPLGARKSTSTTPRSASTTPRSSGRSSAIRFVPSPKAPSPNFSSHNIRGGSPTEGLYEELQTPTKIRTPAELRLPEVHDDARIPNKEMVPALEKEALEMNIMVNAPLTMNTPCERRAPENPLTPGPRGSLESASEEFDALCHKSPNHEEICLNSPCVGLKPERAYHSKERKDDVQKRLMSRSSTELHERRAQRVSFKLPNVVPEDDATASPPPANSVTPKSSMGTKRVSAGTTEELMPLQERPSITLPSKPLQHSDGTSGTATAEIGIKPPGIDRVPPPPPPDLVSVADALTPVNCNRPGHERKQSTGSAEDHRQSRSSITLATNRGTLEDFDVVVTMSPQQVRTTLTKTGSLLKRGGGTSFMGRRNWKSRFFVISQGALSYYDSEEAFKSGRKPIKGSRYQLDLCIAKKDPKDPRRFLIDPMSITGGPRTMHLQAATEKECESWIEPFQDD